MTESNRTKLTGMYVNESYQDKPIDTEVNKPLTGLYVNETKKGDQYLSGKTMDGTKKYLLFKNGFKEKDNQPDWVLYVEDLEATPKAPKKDFSLSNKKVSAAENEDIPF